ncbi:TPA: Rha family transcriptional regulator, partial [Enterococcus faecalis]
MNNLVIMKNQQAVTSSLQVAEVFEKQHKHVLEAIDELKQGVAENSA